MVPFGMPMFGRWFIKPVGFMTLGALGALSCATPVREDPPSKLGEDTTTGGDGSTSTTDSSSPSAGITSSVSSITSTSSASTTTTGTGGAASDSTTAATTGTSDDGSGGGSTTTATTGTGGDGSGGTGGDSSTTVGASTTGAGMTTGELPFEDDFESYDENGPATLWNPMESDGGWVVIAGHGGRIYTPTNDAADNRNLTWAGDETWTNMRLQVEVRMSSGGDDTRIYFAVRAAERGGDSNKLDYYFGYLKGDGVVRLGTYINGSTDNENATSPSGVDPTEWNIVAITVDGDAISMEVNGDVRSTHTLTGRDSGFVALGVDKGLAEFDNLTVTAP